MITAGKDKLVDNKAANHFYSKCGTSAANKKLKQYPWAFHELHKEESIRTCIETAAGEVCRDVPLKKPAVPDLPNKNIAEAKNNTPAAEVTKCKPKGSPKDSSRAMIPECL